MRDGRREEAKTFVVHVGASASSARPRAVGWTGPKPAARQIRPVVDASARGGAFLPIVVLAVLAIAVAACSSTGSSSPSTSTSTTTTASPPPNTSGTSTAGSGAEDVAVLAAYRAEWAAFEHAEADANPLDPLLNETMVNPLLHRVEGYLVTDHQEGIVGRGPITLHPHVASATATTAIVLDCTDSDSVLVYKKTGKQVPPITGPEHVGVKSTLVLDGSTWKVKDQDITEGKCPAGY